MNERPKLILGDIEIDNGYGIQYLPGIREFVLVSGDLEDTSIVRILTPEDLVGILNEHLARVNPAPAVPAVPEGVDPAWGPLLAQGWILHDAAAHNSEYTPESVREILRERGMDVSCGIRVRTRDPANPDNLTGRVCTTPEWMAAAIRCWGPARNMMGNILPIIAWTTEPEPR